MSDIQGWMRKTMMQPARAFTPTAPTAPSDLPLRNALDARSDSGAPTTTGLRAARAASGAGGPRKKISSYFSANTINTVGRVSSLRTSPSSSRTPAPEDLFNWSLDEDDLDAYGSGAGDREALEETMSAIHMTLCQNPFEGLPVGMNKSLLALVEWCRKATVEKEQQQERADTLAERLQEATKRHEDEAAVYKAEIKRLEIFISKGQDGMSRLMVSRQESVLGRKGNNRRNDDGQRRKTETGNCKQGNNGARASVMSPSSKEILLSRQLSMIGPREIPIGTPPQRKSETLLDHHSPPLQNESALSSEGRDYSRIKEIATAICLHRGLKPERVLPRLVAFFDTAGEQIDQGRTGRRPRASGEKQDTNATRPPSWAPGDDAAIQGEARSSTEFGDDGDRPRRPTQTSELSQPRRGSVTSDLSLSSSEETGAEGNDEEHTTRPLIKTKIPSPCPEVGIGAHKRQVGLSPGSPSIMSRTGSSGSEAVVLSSSVSSHQTAFRRSSDGLDYYGSGGAGSTRTAERHANQSAQRAMAGIRPASKSFSGGAHHPPAAAQAAPAAAAASDMSKSKARASMRVAPWTIGSSSSIGGGGGDSSGGGQDSTAVTKQRLNVKENEAGTTAVVGASNRGTGGTAAVGCGEKKNSERAEGDRDVGRRASQVRASWRMHQQLLQQQRREK